MTDADTTHPDSTEPPVELEHIVVENDDGPNECAIFPSEAEETELLTAWISAYEGAYVDLESMH